MTNPVVNIDIVKNPTRNRTTRKKMTPEVKAWTMLEATMQRRVTTNIGYRPALETK